jgi:8-oxo-dGTP pyrophosphatase MutT (NUDIX family)
MPPLSSLPAKALSAGLVLVHHDGQRYRLLCLRVFDAWDFPKGEVQGDADPVETAAAGAREETGITDFAFHWGEEYRETVPSVDGQVSRYYIAQTGADEVVLRLAIGRDGEEDYEYRWATVDEAEDILPPRLALILDWVVRTLASSRPLA